MSAFPALFSPFRLGSLALANRIVMAPMETNMSGPDGSVTDRMIAYYAERAAGGAGLVTVEFTCVDRPAGLGASPQLSLDSDDLIAGHRRLVDAIHAAGSKACLQIHHAGRQTLLKHTGGVQPVAPSAIPCRSFRVEPRELTVPEIAGLVGKFAAAAARAVEAGYDAIELHGAHGYLLGQFLSPHSNRRTDIYGGDEARRLRFPCEVIAAVKAAAGGRPVIYRLSAAEYVEGGLGIEDTARLAPYLVAAGADALHVSTGTGERLDCNVDPVNHAEGWRLPLARAIREAAGVPVIGVGVIRHPEVAEQAIAAGDCDLVALGRALLVDPQWPEKARDGRAGEIRPCTSCNWCIDRLMADVPVGCAENPRAGREGEPDPLSARAEGLRAIVVGAGPGGIQAALMLDAAGMDVTLLEKRAAPGSGVTVSGMPPGKDKFLWYRDHLAGELARSRVALRCGVEATPDMVAQMQPDLAVVAIGGTDRRPPVPGLGLPNVVPAYEVLAGEVALAEGPLVVWGGGETGCEAAEHAAAQGRRVTLVTAGPEKRLARRAQLIYRRQLLKRIAENPLIEVRAGCRMLEILPDGVRVAGEDGAEAHIPAVQVLVAQGRGAQSDFAAALAARGLAVAEIGDCRDVRRIGDAVDDAYEAVASFLTSRASGEGGTASRPWTWPARGARQPSAPAASRQADTTDKGRLNAPDRTAAV